jgi:hypothetical protein
MSLCARETWATPIDHQIWSRFSVIAPLAREKRNSFSLDVHYRLADNVRRTERYIIRPAIHREVRDNLLASFGYDFMPLYLAADFSSRHRNEHRTWEQLLMTEDRSWGRFSLRVRQEQRYIDNQQVIGNRSRILWAMQVPCIFPESFFLNGSQELMYSLNSVVNGPQRGYDRFRTMLGPAYQHGKVRYDLSAIFEHVDNFDGQAGWVQAFSFGVTVTLD